MSYKLNDKVIIKNNLIVGKRYNDNCTFVTEMQEYYGKTTLISVINKSGNSYRLQIDNGKWAWTRDMFELVLDESYYDDTLIELL